jgi:hypothetical protein
MGEIIAVPWPDTRAGTTQAIIEECRRMNFLPRSIVGYANASEWRNLQGTKPPETGSAKYWRSNRPAWGEPEPFYLCIAERDANGKFIALSPKPSGYSEQDETWNFFGPNVATYIQQHSKAIGAIPKLKLFGIRTAGALRMSFAPGVPFDFPIAELIRDPGGPIEVRKRADGSAWAGPSIGPNEGNLRIANDFDGDWFVRLVDGRIEYTACQGFAADGDSQPSGGSLTDEDLAEFAANVIMAGASMSKAEIGRRIREAALA